MRVCEGRDKGSTDSVRPDSEFRLNRILNNTKFLRNRAILLVSEFSSPNLARNIPEIAPDRLTFCDSKIKAQNI